MNNSIGFIISILAPPVLSRAYLRRTLFVTLIFTMVALNSVPTTVIAKTIQDINIGRVVVDNQSSRSQQIAGKQALEQVFIKISGSSTIATNASVGRAIDNYEQYMVSSSFLNQDSNLYFEAQFNQQKIESLLLASGLPVWTNIRPSGILWLAYKPELSNDASNLLLVTQNRQNELTSVVNQAAFGRGIDIILPLGDFEDAVNVSYFDVANQFLTRIRDSSVRYQPDYIISASIERIDAQKALQAQQSLLEERNNASNRVSSEDLPELSDQPQPDTAFNQSELDNKQVDTELLDTIESESYAEQGISTGVDDEQTNLTMTIQSLVEVPIPNKANFKLDYVIAKKTNFSYQLLSTGRLYSENESDITRELIDIYANTVAREFSLSTQSDSSITQFNIKVANVDSLQDHLEIVELFNSIPSIENVSLVSQKGTDSILQVEQKISISQLVSILSLDNRLTIMSGYLDEQNTIFIDWQK